MLSHAAIFVLPSDLEGLSLALLDAMAAGVCVLASDIPENLEVVSGVGFTFRRRDTSDLARVLDVLVHRPALRQQAGEHARQRIRQQYQWPDIARSMQALYLSLLGCQQKTGPEQERAQHPKMRVQPEMDTIPVPEPVPRTSAI